METKHLGAVDAPPRKDLDFPNTPVAESAKGEETSGKSNDSSFKYFLRVFTYNDNLGWLLNTVAFVCMIAAGTLLPLMDVVFGKFVNVFNDFASGSLSPSGYRSEVSKFTLYFLYLFIGKFVLTYIWTVLVSTTAIRATKKLRVDFVRQTLRQEIPFFDSPSSSVSGQITTNGNLINNGISEKFGLTIQAMSTFVTAFIVAFVVQWKLTLIICCIVPVNLGVTIVCVIYDTIYEYNMFDIYSKSGSLAEEAFSTIRTAHAFWAFPKLSRRFNDTLEEARKVGQKKSLVYAVLFPTELALNYFGYALAFWRGFAMYSSGEISQPGTVVTVIFAVLVASTALTQVAPQTIAISKATAAAQDMFTVIDRESAIDSLSNEGAEICDFQGEISFRNVQFAYPSRPNVPVLRGLNLEVSAQKTTAVVGASGSGKSTIFGLLERWYSASEGSITLQGHPIESLNLRWLRTNIRLVQQEPTLFSGTVFQNIVDGLTGTALADITDDEKTKRVQEACEAAFAHDFIMELPDGYDTYIGERGASLSGGQKQRIVIARSIISNPKVLLLDEATSALDPNAEKIVQGALNNVAKGRTMIVVAHRLSTIRDADLILVMSKGETIEQGTHEELVQQGGAYAKLVKAQDLGGRYDQQGGDTDNMEDPKVDIDVVPTQVSHAASATEVFQSSKTNYTLMTGLWYILKEQKQLWGKLAVAGFLLIGGGISYPAMAILFAYTMEAFQAVDVGKGNFFSLMFVVLALANIVIFSVSGWIVNGIGQHIMKHYRGEVFDNTLRQDMRFFDEIEHSTGALVSRLAAEPTSLQELLSMNIGLILVNVVSIFSSSILAIAYGWKLGLVLSLAALPVLVGAGLLRIRLEFKFDEDTASRFARSSGLASEAVMAIRTVSSLALESAVIERYDAALHGIAQQAIGGLGWKMLFYSLSQSISFLAMALGFWYGGRLVSTGEYTVKQFYVVFIAVILSGEAAAVFFQYSTSITKARTAMNYIFSLRQNKELLDRDRNSEDHTNYEKPGVVKGSSVSCQDVAFSYPLRPHIKVLRGIDLDVASSKMIALVGASGCGKSTMIALLERFYDPTSGEVRVDDKDISGLDRRVYRQDVALVQQEPVLYQGSIKDNISLGIERRDPSEDEIMEACRQANVWDFVSSLPEGTNTPCGNQGLSLSGGQRQRIAIARALIRKPRLLLLDEATSALDTESEKVVKEALDRAAEGRTTVAVAHRLSTIRDADTIAVFEKGRIVEIGTHDQLLAKKHIYYEMVLGQSLDREAT